MAIKHAEIQNINQKSQTMFYIYLAFIAITLC